MMHLIKVGRLTSEIFWAAWVTWSEWTVKRVNQVFNDFGKISRIRPKLSLGS